MGLTNIALVNSQTVLGELHDLDRLEEIMKENGESEDVLGRLRRERSRLYGEWMQCRDNLPYGLRPGITHLARNGTCHRE